MASLTFTFVAGLPRSKRDEVLESIRRIGGVQHAGQLNPGATHPEIARMGFAEADDRFDLDSLAADLQRLPEIESASVPVKRQLV